MYRHNAIGGGREEAASQCWLWVHPCKEAGGGGELNYIQPTPSTNVNQGHVNQMGPRFKLRSSDSLQC